MYWIYAEFVVALACVLFTYRHDDKMFVDAKMSRACCALAVKLIICEMPDFQISIHTEGVQDELSVPLVNIMEMAL